MKLQYRLLELFDAMLLSADFPEGFRAAVELRGFRFGPSRQPLSGAQQVDRTRAAAGAAMHPQRIRVTCGRARRRLPAAPAMNEIESII